jgi:diguanylate cyclase (GGDEF)-like protein
MPMTDPPVPPRTVRPTIASTGAELPDAPDPSAGGFGGQPLAARVEQDELMGLPNRHRMQAAIEGALAHLRARLAPSAVLLIDLDGLDEASEPARAELARRLAASLRRDDMVARFGGDVFVIVAREVADDAAAHALATRLKRELDEPLRVGNELDRVRASVGVSLMRAEDASDSAVVARADAAMYAAKNKASRDARGDDARPPERTREALVQAAFERSTVEDFDVYYQPIVDLRGGSVAAVEAVLHWEHPDLETIAPAEFLPLVERRGQIVTLGRWAIEKASAQTVRWAATRDGRAMRTCVNVSPAQVMDPAFVEDVAAALARSGATGRQLALAMSPEGIASISADVADRLVAARIELILRNVGTGRASAVAELAHLPISMVKLDGSLMARYAQDDVIAILQQTAELARRLDARAVAAGVETLDGLAMAIECGFSLAQGYLFRRPQSAPSVEQLVYGERPFASLLAPRPAWLDLPLDGDAPTIEFGAPAVP